MFIQISYDFINEILLNKGPRRDAGNSEYFANTLNVDD